MQQLGKAAQPGGLGVVPPCPGRTRGFTSTSRRTAARGLPHSVSPTLDSGTGKAAVLAVSVLMLAPYSGSRGRGHTQAALSPLCSTVTEVHPPLHSQKIFKFFYPWAQRDATVTIFQASFKLQ